MIKNFIILILIIAACFSIGALAYGIIETSKGYDIYFQNGGELITFDEKAAMESIKPNGYDSGYYSVIDYGTKTVQGVTVYYTKYIDLENNNTVRGNLYFKKNGKWYNVGWKDKPGNTNGAKIDREISRMIKTT